MAPHQSSLILLIITTTINFAITKLFLKMPLTLNPAVQDAITVRGKIVKRFSRQDPTFFSRLTPVDIVMKLNYSLSFVMHKNIAGIVVLGLAAKSAGLQVEQLSYKPNNKWTVRLPMTEIKSVLREDEKRFFPLTDNITLTELQNLGLHVLQRRYNVLLRKISESLFLSTSMTYQSIQDDWIRVVKFITGTNVDRLARKHQVSVSALAKALNFTSRELYAMTLDQLDGVLSTRFVLSRGSLKVVVPTVGSSNITNIKTTLVSQQGTTPESYGTSHTSKEVKANRTVEAKHIRENDTKKLALLGSLPAGLLLLLVATSTVWCVRGKRRHSAEKNDIKTTNFMIETCSGELLPRQDEVGQKQFKLMISP